MSSRIVIPTPSGGGGRDTTPPASAQDLGHKIKAAVAAGAFYALGVWVLLTVVWAIILILAALVGEMPPVRWILGVEGAVVVIALLLGLRVTCERGYEWAQLAAERPWRVDDDERAYRRKQEEDARKAQEAAAARAKENIRRGPMDHDNNPATLNLEQELNLVAWEMLARATLGRGKPTREAMEGDGVCSQQQWNLVNEAMQAIGLRKGYTWQAATFEQAWDTWRANFRVQVDGDGAVYAWALRPGGRWKVVERVA